MDAAVGGAARKPAAEALLFREAFDKELCEVRRRRRLHYLPAEAERDPRDTLVGLALSGGGIRSATFCLGLLQGFADRGFLRVFDYLSTVSGGGFAGAWWTACLSRNLGGEPQRLFPPAEQIAPGREEDYRQRRPEAALAAGRDPVHHLRLFSNYLTPRKGLLSADTWRGAPSPAATCS